MNTASLISIEYAMSINDFHLHAAVGDSPEFLHCFFSAHLKIIEHPGLIFLTERNGCLTPAAKTATCALKYWLHNGLNLFKI